MPLITPDKSKASSVGDTDNVTTTSTADTMIDKVTTTSTAPHKIDKVTMTLTAALMVKVTVQRLHV